MDWGGFILQQVSRVLPFLKPYKQCEVRNKIGSIFFAHKMQGLSYITEFKIEVLFINNNSKIVNLTDFAATFYDGDNWHNLHFDPSKVPPYISLDSNRPQTVSFTLPTIEEMPLPLLAIEITHLVLSYRERKKTEKVFMDEVRIFNPPNGYT